MISKPLSVVATVVFGLLSHWRLEAQAAQDGGRRVFDPAGHVSFVFPAGWVREPDVFETEPVDYFVPAIFTMRVAGRRIRLSLNRSPWRGTEFTRLSFAEMSFPVGTEHECLDAVQGMGSLEAEEPRVIDGVHFAHDSTGGAGMCHQAFGQVYATFRGGRCFAFEADRYTHCGAVGERMLTRGEIRDLDRRLDRIVESIRFDAARRSRLRRVLDPPACGREKERVPPRYSVFGEKFLALSQGLDDLENGLDTPAAADARKLISTMRADQMQHFSDMVSFLGQYGHGTHVAGIAVKGNPAARLVVIQFDDALPDLPFVPSVAWAEKFKADFKMVGEYLRDNNVRGEYELGR